jgi:hypothetical protein
VTWNRYEIVALVGFVVFTLLTAAVSLALAVLYGIGTVSTECAC